MNGWICQLDKEMTNDLESDQQAYKIRYEGMCSLRRMWERGMGILLRWIANYFLPKTKVDVRLVAITAFPKHVSNA